MKKICAILLCLGLSGCYYVEEGYYDEVYTTPATAYTYSDSGYVYSAPTVVYEQPVVTYYESYHYAPPTPRPHHHAAPRPHHHAAPSPHHHAAPSPHHHAAPSPHHHGGNGRAPRSGGASHHRLH